MKKIICVTLNPAMDKTILVDNLHLGRVNLIDEVTYTLGGRGINIAKVLKNFEVKSIITGFIGGIWSDNFRTKLMKLGIETKFFKVIPDTRVNTKLIDKETGTCTTINEKGPYIPEELVERFIQSFTIMCQQEDIIVLTGSIPPGVPMDIYYTLTEIAKKKGAFVILDAYGEALQKGVAAEPDLLKITYRDFLDDAYWNKLTRADFSYIVKKVQKIGIKKIMVSLGQYGALFIDGDVAYYAEAIDMGLKLKHPVGAGDSMVASLVMGELYNWDIHKVMRYAVACGAACVVSKDVTNCTKEEVEKLLPEVKINRLILE